MSESCCRCADMGVGAVPYSPQGKGRVLVPGANSQSGPAKTRSSSPSTRDEPVVNAVQHVAEARGASMAQVALAWVMNSPFVSAPIVGANKPHHLQEAVAALDLHLTDDEIQSLEEPYTPQGRSWFQETVTQRRETAQ